MDHLINHLVQLQELTLIRDEQKAASHTAHLEQLDESIRSMIKGLPEAERDHYTKLVKKDHTVIVPVTDDHCTGCGMKLPISLVQIVRQGKTVENCPNCARMLYCAVAAPKRVPKRERRSAPPKVGINRFSAASLMVPDLKADDMDGCIEGFAALMEQEGFINDGAKLADLAMARESVLSTAVDHGLAFPHVRGVEGGALTFALGTSKEGLDLGAPEGKPTHIVFFIVIPTAASAFYLKLLAGLTQTCRKPEARKAMLEETTPAALWKALVKLTRSTIK